MTPPKNRRLVVFIAVGGLLVGALLAYNLFGKGSDSSSAAKASAPASNAITASKTASSTTSTTAPPGEPSVPGGTFDVFATRNPFEPVVQITPSTPIETTPTTTGGTSPTTTPTTPTTAPPSQNPSAGTPVALIDVFEQDGQTLVRVQVGSTVYTVAAGQTFATSYKLVSVSGTCAQFLYGDSPFSLCEGEEVIK